MTKQMKRCRIVALLMLICMIFTSTVFATDVDTSNYEAKITIDVIKTGESTDYYYTTLEEAVADLAVKEAAHNTSGAGGVITVTLQLLKTVTTDTTINLNTKNTNCMLDLNGCSITSSADPVIQTGAMTFINNKSAAECSVTQANVTTPSQTAPNTIIYAPAGTMMVNVAAENATFGDGTGTALKIASMLPSIQDGIFLGELQIGKPMFGAAIMGGFFSEDPTPHIDTLAYVAVKNDEDLYYLTQYHAATADPETGDIITKYGLVQDAIDISEAGGLVKIIKQDYPPKTILVRDDDEITLDLAGFQLTGAASPSAGVRVDGDSLITNDGILNIIDTLKEDPGALNYVYSEDFEDEAFCTIYNKGLLNIEDVNITVNYNQPNVNGNITTLFNDSLERDAIITIDAASLIGGLTLEPEDPATGKYPAFATKGTGEFVNGVIVGYAGNDLEEGTEDDDTVAFYTENCIVSEIENVFDVAGNYTTTLAHNNGVDLQKKNISVTKAGEEIEFEYDSTTDVLTIPAEAFTEGADDIIVKLQYFITYIAGDNTVDTIVVGYGKTPTAPLVPNLEGHTASDWDKVAQNVTEDTTIYADYTPIPEEEPEEEPVLPEDEENEENEEVVTPEVEPPATGDTVLLWASVLVICALALRLTLKHSFSK